MKRKLYAQAFKANAKRFCEAEIEDQLIEIENILDGACSNPSHVLSAVHIEENHNVQDNDLIVEDVLHNPPNHEIEDAEYNEHSSSDEAENE